MDYSDFINDLLPGNYALTKSMELTKIKSSGTLWYTKKFLTLYYYIFLTNDIYTNDYIGKVISVFDNYINSLDSSLTNSAVDFFYSINDNLNFKSTRFKTFSSFTNYTSFANANEKQIYDRTARKYYFALLMGVGGQTGVKRELKEKIQDSSFVFSDLNVQSAIVDGAIKICIEQANTRHLISDNSIKYILSDDTIQSIINLSNTRLVTEEDVKSFNLQFPHNNPNYSSIKNDMIAFIRNERQVLYYYGFFHSKSSGATDFEFSSLTPVGHTALNSNYYEFIAIWEHQKIKMISQPVTVDINDVPRGFAGVDKFSISYSPYTDILGCLLRRGSISVDDYMYIISRRNHTFSEEEWAANEDLIFQQINLVRDKVNSFGRKRDIKDEDGRKELLKYLLGIRGDLTLDNLKNPLQSCRYDTHSSSYVIEDTNRLKRLFEVYSRLSNYKKIKNSSLFDECESDLKKRYISAANGLSSEIDAMTKIRWDLYNIHIDKFINLTIIFQISANYIDLDLMSLNKNEVNDIAEYSFSKFKNMLKTFSLTTLNKVKRMVNLITVILSSEDYSEFMDKSKEDSRQILADYRSKSTEDLLSKIKSISSSYSEQEGERVRNTTLVSLLKSYYMARFMENDTLKCECCGNETFITYSGEPYIEFHHLIPFNIALGPDHYLNLYALCPNCHRKLHFLNVSKKELEYRNIDTNNYLELEIIQRLRELKDEKILCSYHLEYLLADMAINLTEYNMIAA